MEKVHTFTVTVSKGTGEAARSAKQSLQVRPRDPAVPIPTGVLTRDCSGACSARHSAVQPLSVSLKLEKQAALLASADKQVQIDWAVEPKGLQPLVVPAGAQFASATRNGQVQLIIPAEALPNAAAVTVSVVLGIPGQQGQGSASLSVPLNSPPIVAKEGLAIEWLGNGNHAGQAPCRLSMAGITDEEELT